MKYRDTSIIVRIFTSELGLQSYIVNGTRNKNSKTKMALFQPLTILELVVYSKENKDLHRISEVKCSCSYSSIPFNITKSSISLVLSEFLSKVLVTTEKSESLYNFVSESMKSFDTLKVNYENFHLFFLLKLSEHLGFYLEDGRQLKEILREGSIPLSSFTEEIESNVSLFLSGNFHDPVPMSGHIRHILFKYIINFYQLQTGSIKELKSLAVLKEVLQ